MSRAKQYIELFEQAHGMINQHGAHLLNQHRAAALQLLRATDLPDTSHEAYPHSDVASWFAPDYGLNLNRVDIPVNPYEIFKCDVPNLSTHLYFLVNDGFYHTSEQHAKLPEGVFVGSLKQFAEQHPQLAEQHYNRLAATQQDGTVQLNTLFAQDGFVLYVPKGVKLEKPIQLVNALRSDVDLLVNRRILVILERHAEAKLLVCDHAMNPVQFLANQVAELFVGEGAHFDYYELEENSAHTHRVASTFLHQEAKSNVMCSAMTLTCGATRNNFYIRLQGEGAITHLSGMAIADATQHIDNYSFVDHAVPHCESRELFKYVLNDHATGAFRGRILVREGAQKTEAYQSNKNLCATPTARMFTRPELEIYADDVKCSHGATVGQLDLNALFYLRARGVSESEARLLLMYAFCADVIEQVRLEPLKDRLRMLTEKRFRGELAKCKGCVDCH